MLAIVGADLVLPDQVLRSHVLLISGEMIVAIATHDSDVPEGATRIEASGCVVVPGFIDLHVHGVAGHDVLDEGEPVASIAKRLPQFGVTAFCPTTVACAPNDLRRVLVQIRTLRGQEGTDAARVLGAHLESNFINPSMRGAQPAEHLRPFLTSDDAAHSEYGADEILAVLEEHREDVAIVTLAPELPGAIDLVRRLSSAGHCVSLGHSAADFDTANAAFEAGARHATHLFNRMPPLSHRAPGLAGAVLSRSDVTAELICDGHHVHPAMARIAVVALGRNAVAITDGTAGAAMPVGSCARLGGRTIHVREQVAVLEDGTLAGSTLTMDRAFRAAVNLWGGSLVDAASMCATAPARALRRPDCGILAAGAAADLVVLDQAMQVVHTCVGGRFVYSR